MMKKHMLAAGVILLAAAGTQAAEAQGAMDRGMGMMGMGMGMMGAGCDGKRGGGMGPGMGRGMMHGMAYDADKVEEMVEARLDSLKKDLDIGEQQTGAWDNYEEVVKERIKAMQTMHEAMADRMQKANAVERMEARIGHMENMLDSMKALLPATKALYDALPDKQKGKADMLLGGCGML